MREPTTFMLLSGLVGKIRERGTVWLLKAIWRRLGWPILLVIYSPMSVLLATARIRFLTSGNLLSRVGHLAHEPEIYVKSRLVGWRPSYRGILLAPSGSVVNHCLLSYWRRYITIVNDPLLIAFLRPLTRIKRLQYQTGRFTFPDGTTATITPALYPIQTEYEAKYGGRAVLRLHRADFEEGWRCLQKLGLPRDAWFVCLHVREAGYLPHLQYHSYRNANVDTYFLAVEAIVARGGWILRMGDPTMKPLLPMAHVIDYARGDVRSDTMDVFCFASCRFYLGSPSGPVAISQVFGVPAAVTDWAPMGQGPYSRRDIWIPKLCWSNSENRNLTFAEVLKSPLRKMYTTEEFDAAGVSLIDNSPEELKALAVEMMDRLDGHLLYTAEDEHLQKQFKSFLEADPMYGTNARVGRDFLRKYAWLFPEGKARE